MDEHGHYHLYHFKDNSSQHPGKKYQFLNYLQGNTFLNDPDMNHGARQFPSEVMKKRLSSAH